LSKFNLDPLTHLSNVSQKFIQLISIKNPELSKSTESEDVFRVNFVNSDWL